MEIQVPQELIWGKVENKLQMKKWWGTDEKGHIYSFIVVAANLSSVIAGTRREE